METTIEAHRRRYYLLQISCFHHPDLCDLAVCFSGRSSLKQSFRLSKLVALLLCVLVPAAPLHDVIKKTKKKKRNTHRPGAKTKQNKKEAWNENTHSRQSKNGESGTTIFDMFQSGTFGSISWANFHHSFFSLTCLT